MNSSKNKPPESLLTIANKKLRKEDLASLYEAILNHAGYAMIATDIDGIIVLFNPAAEQMLGFSAQELVGQKTPAIWHDPLEIELRAE